MTESVMFFGIGFVVAALLCLLIVLHVHNRSARLGSVDEFQADVRQIEEQLTVALGERSKLQREIAAIKRDAELAWAAERVESALFRERINDVAYEITRITQALERPGSLIEPMSAYAVPDVGQGRRTGTPGSNGARDEASAPATNRGALAERIRALRMVASRAAAAN